MSHGRNHVSQQCRTGRSSLLVYSLRLRSLKDGLILDGRRRSAAMAPARYDMAKAVPSALPCPVDASCT